MTGSAAGRADLVRAYAALGEEGLSAAAGLLGYAERGSRRQREQETAGEALDPALAAAQAPAQPFAPIPFWSLLAVEYREAALPPAPPPPSAPLGFDGVGRRPGNRPAGPPIVPDARLWPALRRLLASTAPSREIDVLSLARRWSRGETVVRLPFRPLAAWVPRIAVAVDRSPRLIPFWHDQDRLLRLLRRRLGPGAVEEVVWSEGRPCAWERRLHNPTQPAPGEPRTPFLAVGDLGFGTGGAEQAAWRALAERGRAGERRCVALVTCPAERWDRPSVRAWSALEWERPSHAPLSSRTLDDAQLRDRAERLLALLSFAARIEPGLLRAVRRLLPASEADAGTEVDAWNHPYLISGFAPAGTLVADARRPFQERFRSESDAVKRGVVARMRAWRADLPAEVWHDEMLSLWAAGDVPHGALDPKEVEAARAFVARLADTVDGPVSPDLSRAAAGFARRSLSERQPAALWEDPELRPLLWRMWQVVRRGEGEPALPAGVGPEGFHPAASEARRWQVWQVAEALRFFPAGHAPDAGSPLAEVASADGRVAVEPEGARLAAVHILDPDAAVPLPIAPSLRLRTDRTTVTLRRETRPPWATAMGRDRFGLWASFEVEGVAQRLHWIPPGRTWMGSPEDEPGRWPDEGPRHLEAIAHGFWLADTPCTQALWEVVMGGNPSRFRSADRPVEQVSWEDVQTFFLKLGERVPGLEPRLPTEAEWEYACRAGTETATYAGPIEILGQNNAPVLDAIAWYGGNSGVDFDLQEGEDSTNWPEKQYPHTKAGTRPVAQKAPNAWGLHDMLGNVYEWCDDLWSSDYEGPREGTLRVIRGGSWFVDARLVRAAYRNHSASRRSAGTTWASALPEVRARSSPGRSPRARSAPAALPGAGRAGEAAVRSRRSEAMRVKFFAVPALAPGEAEEELNRFLASHRVLALDRQLVAQGQGAYWAVSVSFLDGKADGLPLKRGKIDYKEVLSEADFALFARLRSLRKDLADRDGVPAYAIFTNEQLAAMVSQRVRTDADLAALAGVGTARVERYGEPFLALLRVAPETHFEAPPKTDG